MARFATLQTSPHPFPIPIPAIRSRSVRFQFRFLKSDLALWQSDLGFLKSEVTGSLSCSDSWNPGCCGASQMVGNFGALSIILMDCESGHIVVIL